MINAWKFETKDQFNEEIITGTDKYEDSRGLIENYYFNDPINMIGAVTSKRGWLEVIITIQFRHKNAF